MGLVWIFLLSHPFSPSLWETARYRLKYCLKGPLNQKQQATNRNSLQPAQSMGPFHPPPPKKNIQNLHTPMQCFFSRYDTSDPYFTFHLKHQHLPIMCGALLDHTRTVNLTEHINLKKKTTTRGVVNEFYYFQNFESGKK